MAHRLAFLILVLCVTSCATAKLYQLRGQGDASGALGDAQVEKLEGSNYLLIVRLNHLPSPSLLDTKASVWLVWVRLPQNNTWMRAGPLQYDEKKSQGNLVSALGFSGCVLRLSAEERADANQPTGPVLLERSLN